MEIDELFKKLKPVLGQRADALWLAHKIDKDARGNIEKIVYTLSARLLDQTFDEKQIHLEPPDQENAAGDYSIATVLYGNKSLHAFGLREHEWIQHAGIFGRSGCGKTNVVYLIIQNFLGKGKPFLIFDWKRNYRDLLQLEQAKDILVFTVGRNICPFCFNPLIPPKGTQPTVWVKKLIEIMCHVYFLGEGVAYLLLKAIDNLYQEFGVYQGCETYPTLLDLKEWLENYKPKGRESQWMDSTLRLVGTLCFGEMGRVLNVRKPTPLEDYLERSVIFELDSLTDSDKTFFIEGLLLWIHHFRLQEKQRETFKHAIIIEEAHHILLKR